MKQNEKQAPSYKEWKSLPISTKLLISWIVFRSSHLKRYKKSLEKGIKKIDLWILPPIAFLGCYLNIEKLFPKDHPMSTLSIIGTSFMFATLITMIIRPKEENKFHWIKAKGTEK